MKPIIVGLHPSRPVSSALDWAVAEARSRHRPLHVQITRGSPMSTQTEVPVDTLLPQSVAEDVVRQAIDHVRELDPSMKVTGQVSTGSAGAVLVEASRAAELVVVGRHGHGRLAEVLLGSTSAQVAAHGEVPVVVVNDAQVPLDTGGAVVVGVDGSPANRAAIDFSFEMADRRGAPLVALHAWELNLPENVTLPWMTTEGMRQLVQSQERMLHEALAGWCGRFPDVTVRHVVSRQHAVDRLAQEARSASLVVVGGRGHGGFSGLLVGSVSRGLLHRPDICPLVVVHGATPESHA